jgi:hypothetical protein
MLGMKSEFRYGFEFQHEFEIEFKRKFEFIQNWRICVAINIREQPLSLGNNAKNLELFTAFQKLPP